MFRLRDTLAGRFSDLCYNGFWFSPEMEFILHAVKKSQEVRTAAICVRVACLHALNQVCLSLQAAPSPQSHIHPCTLRRCSA